MVQLIQIADVTPLGRDLRAQPLKLSAVVPGEVFAHDVRGVASHARAAVTSVSCHVCGATSASAAAGPQVPCA